MNIRTIVIEGIEKDVKISRTEPTWIWAELVELSIDIDEIPEPVMRSPEVAIIGNGSIKCSVPGSFLKDFFIQSRNFSIICNFNLWIQYSSPVYLQA